MIELLGIGFAQIVIIALLFVVLLAVIVLAFFFRTRTRTIGHFVPMNRKEVQSILVAVFLLAFLFSLARAAGWLWFSAWNLDQALQLIAGVSGFVASIAYYNNRTIVISLSVMLVSLLLHLLAFTHLGSVIPSFM